ncbi:hypothetical protein B0T24DRAFT_74435 [Lasiosphaeria ovina]|uniref:SWR1-complex protein 4 n=1 Tax=Lasiosphaeria ovina TaxID=92902 RepID=A0AAE0NMH5_9PEZI|nr:hypothetical protein B0T24DRAFT_74435 [Lasiosphaeria ovina]
MASHDLRDVLNLPSDHSSTPRPSKKQRTGPGRPNLKGLAREVQNLGGDNPIAIVPEAAVFKKRRVISRKPAARWELRPFTNSARGDDGALILRHWRRKTDHDAPPDAMEEDGEPGPVENAADGERQVEKTIKTEDSTFAKFNVEISIPQYNDDQYRANLERSDWSKEETGYLLKLVQDYDLRWPIIWDRYDYSPQTFPVNGEAVNGDSTAVVPVKGEQRSMEALKARYYEVATVMMSVQKPAQYMTGPEFQLYETMMKFDPLQEEARKEFALNTMARSKEEAREEESLLLEMKRILARTERFKEERRELYQRLDYPSTDADINTYKTSTGLNSLLQNLMNVDKTKKRKSIMASGEGVSPGTAVPPTAVSEAGPNRRESIAATGPSHRESISGTPVTPAEPTPKDTKKKGAAPAERRKLSEQEEQVYGVTHHDRLGSGPTFRYEKINKLYSHKSGQQQLRITNALGELDIPARLAMPTAAVTGQFEVLWSAVTALVDLRKVSDRLDADIKVEEHKKAERDKARGITNGGGDASSRDRSVRKDGAGPNGSAEKSDERRTEPGTAETKPETRPRSQRSQHNDLQNGNGGTAAAEPKPGSGGPGEGANVDGAPAEVKEEPGAGEREKLGPRPSSSGAHKRSASVLSTISDKSAKRQKK